MRFRFTTEQTAFLTSGRAADIRAEYRRQAEKYADSLRIQTRLRSLFPDLAPALLAACIEAFSLEDAAVEKCVFPAGNLVTRTALEMASSAPVAALHASLFENPSQLLDIAAGVGGDAIALSARAGQLTCIEADPAHARMLAFNLGKARRRNSIVLRGTAERWLPLLRLHALTGVFADPMRRDDTQRHTDTDAYRPSLRIFDDLPSSLPVVVKISPAAEAPAGWNVATVASGASCPEQLLSRNIDLPDRCAVDAGSGERWIPSSHAPVSVRDPRYLIEPHAAIIRTGRVADYLREQGAEPIDTQIAYGWSEVEPPLSPWHRSFRLLRVAGYNRKQLKRIAVELDFGPSTEIKKRGFPDTPEQIRASLRLRGARRGVILLTRKDDGHLMLFAERCDV